MRAPTNRRSDQEIIDAIIKKAGDRSVEPLVKRRLADLRDLFSPFTGNRRDNREYLRDLAKDFDGLKERLTRAPWPLSAALSKPEMFNTLVDLQYSAIGINPQTRLIAQGPSRLTKFLADLDSWRARYEQLRDVGESGLRDYRKLGCAIASRELLEHNAVMTEGELSLSCRRESKYCEIAALFFEALTGKHAADLRRQCETVRGKR